ncbi:MAG: DUF1552 domain-containing protein [Rhodobacteraceae bacterium]|nr:DUF1552 domain-containing protein [Paracoccaceae bacterium]
MSVLLPRKVPRRAALRGMLNGAAVTLALPFLDRYLNSNGTALAATGASLPVRFGTWYWGMGHTPGHAIGEKRMSGAGIEFLTETASLKRFESKLNFFAGFGMPLDGRSNYTHFTGWVGSRTGSIPQKQGDIPDTTLDLIIADEIGNNSRFKTIDASSTGMPRENYSARSAESRAEAEISPVALYTRLFGPEFVDPNSATFTPDPNIMLEKSVLSGFGDVSKSYIAELGAADRERMDEYFTSIRQLENQMATQLQKPEPNAACVRPDAPKEVPAERVAASREMPNIIETHAIMAKLLAMAVACDQTRVFNMSFTDANGNVRRPGESSTHHLLTHAELVDPALGYQPETFWFNTRCSEGFSAFLDAFDGIKEGDGTLLDNCLIFANSETAYAKLHTVDGIPVFFAGKAGGRIKTGMQFVGGGDPITRVGLTAMNIMGVSAQSWGTKSMRTSKPLAELMA